MQEITRPRARTYIYIFSVLSKLIVARIPKIARRRSSARMHAHSGVFLISIALSIDSRNANQWMMQVGADDAQSVSVKNLPCFRDKPFVNIWRTYRSCVLLSYSRDLSFLYADRRDTCLWSISKSLRQWRSINDSRAKRTVSAMIRAIRQSTFISNETRLLSFWNKIKLALTLRKIIIIVF